MADQTYTLPALQAGRLGHNEAGGSTHKYVIDFGDVNGTNAGGTWTTDGDTVTITLGATPADWVASNARLVIETAFATDGTLTAMVGTDGDPDQFIVASDAKTAGPIAPDSTDAANLVGVAGLAGTAADNLVIRFTTQAATGAPADITAGRAIVYLKIDDVAAWDQGDITA